MYQENYNIVQGENISIDEWFKINIISPSERVWRIGELSAPDEKVWVNWRSELSKDKKLTKIPYMPNGKNAKTDNPETWSTFDEVNAARGRFDGIGFVFTGKSFGIDMDHSVENGVTSTEILCFIEKTNTYTEVSPSGTGLHIYLGLTEPMILEKKKAPRGFGRDYEVYTTGRFFTVTGTPYLEARPVRTVTPAEALELLKIIGYPWKVETSVTTRMAQSGLVTLDDKDLLRKMFSSKNGAKIEALYKGDTSEHGGDDSSADAALCSHLAFWTGRDASQITSLWLSSPLGSRSKTQERKDYQESTVTFAIEHCKETYKSPLIRDAEWREERESSPIVDRDPDPRGSLGAVEEVVSIEAIEEMLQQIPSDTPKVKRQEALKPIFQKLVRIEKITAEAFITENIKAYFKMTKEDAKKYIPYLNSLKIQAIQARKKAKEEKEKLPLILDRDIDSQEVLAAVLEIGRVTESMFKIVTAVVISSRLRLNPPLWLFLIGVPSSFKTEFVGLFSAMDEVFTLDTLTENAFASGYVPPDGSEPQDMLPLLDNKSFVIKDLNTLFSMNEEMVKKILGDLTSIFDGKFEKFTATRGMVSYSSLFSMIGCVTPSILTKHYNYATQLGPRFFFLRLPELSQKDMDTWLEKSWTEQNRDKKIIETRRLVSSYATLLIRKIKEHPLAPESKEIQDKVNHIAQFICKARGIAISRKSTFKNEKSEDVTYFEISDWQIEEPWRILNQIKALLRVLAFINGNTTVGAEEIALIQPIILSTMPVDRAEILGALVVSCGLSAKELSKRIGKSSKTINRTMKELWALGIVDCYKDPTYNTAGNAPWSYFIVGAFASLLNAPIPSPESVSLSKRSLEATESVVEDTEEDTEVEDDGIANF